MAECQALTGSVVKGLMMLHMMEVGGICEMWLRADFHRIELFCSGITAERYSQRLRCQCV